MSMDDVCVIVPVYNEQHTIATTVSDLRRSFDHVVCVDDGSHDDSSALARAAGATVLRHVVNQGQGAALRTGFDYVLRHTSASHAVTFDADGQHLVEDAVRMVARARAELVDVVLASRFTGSTEEMPLLRELVLRAAVRFTRLTSRLDVTDTHNGLRVLSRRAVERIDLTMPRMAHASELLEAIVPAGLSYVEEPTTVIYTEYSRLKGQRISNTFNILFDLAVRRLRAVQ
jgi:glycosyltransferase involved in cell wall biosynthesis